MSNIIYQQLKESEINKQLFEQFERRQNVTKCYRKVEGEWVIKDVPFIDQWKESDYEILVKCLKNTVQTGGIVIGAMDCGILKGFVSVESELFGTKQNYLDLTSIHVSEELRGDGIGKKLFMKAAEWAKEKGAEKLYISAHSALETQKFYRGLGCVDAIEKDQKHVEAEPFDCQLEYVLVEENKMEFPKMRRRKQELSEQESWEVLQNGITGVMAVCGEIGYPYTVPLNYACLDGKIYFHCAKTGHKLDAIRYNDKVSFLVIDKDDVVAKEFTTYFRSVIAFGRATLITDDKLKREALQALIHKYSKEYEAIGDQEIDRFWNNVAIVEITIESITGKQAKELCN